MSAESITCMVHTWDLCCHSNHCSTDLDAVLRLWLRSAECTRRVETHLLTIYKPCEGSDDWWSSSMWVNVSYDCSIPACEQGHNVSCLQLRFNKLYVFDTLAKSTTCVGVRPQYTLFADSSLASCCLTSQSQIPCHYHHCTAQVASSSSVLTNASLLL